METQVVTAHLPKKMAQAIDESAHRLERPKGWIVKQALQNWLDQEEIHKQLTLEAMEAVNRGDHIDHATMLGWAKYATRFKRPFSIF